MNEYSELYIVTIKLPRNPTHNPRNKITAPCPLNAQECTDSTGQHHSVLWDAVSEDVIREHYNTLGVHVTRIERANNPWTA